MLLWRSGLRYLLRHRAVLVLSVVGIALGVAVVIGIDLANASAMRAFLLSNEAISGKVTHQVLGSAQGVPEEFYVQLRKVLPQVASAPVLEGGVRVVAGDESAGGSALTLLGVDMFAEAPFRDVAQPGYVAGDLARLLYVPNSVVLTEQAASRLDVELGGMLQARVGTREVRLEVVGLLRPRTALEREGLEHVLISDVATAQELLARVGFLSRIELIVANPDQIQAVTAMLPPGLRLVAAANRSYAMTQMTDAFRINLLALSLLALVVGMFLIYNTMTFSVLQRRALLGSLRVLGVTRAQIYVQVLIEAALLGMAGTLLGVLLGIALGQGLVHLVVRTINDLYFSIQVTDVSVTWTSLLKGCALGLGASLVSALLPALEAARTPPRVVLLASSLETRARRLLPYVSAAGVLVLALGAGGLALEKISLELGFASLFAVILGFALLTPVLALALVAVVGPLLGVVLGLLGRMAARSIRISLSRTGVAMAALAVAIAATVGVTIMVQSFRLAVDRWLENYLRADVFVSPTGAETDFTRTLLDPRLLEALGRIEGVRFVSSGRRVDLVMAEHTVQVFALNLPRDSFGAFRLKHGDAERAERAFYDEGGVIVTEPFAQRHALGVGDRVTLPTDAGPHSFLVAGVYYDYGSDQGYVTMHRATYERHWRDRGITSMGLYTSPGADVVRIEREARNLASAIQEVQVFSNTDLRRESLAIFDRTFMVTNVVRMLAILVAFVGVLSALMAIQMERAREMAVLRATGLTPRQLWGLVLSETATIGLIAGIIALPLGVALSLGLIFVINQLSFGWSMPVHIDPAVLAQALALGVAAALLAGLYPAKKMAATSPARALRQD